MADELSVDSFWDLLHSSGLISEEQFRTLKGELCADAANLGTARQLADELVRRNVLTEWQGEMLLKGKSRGFHLGPYRILRPLGQGGMSTVFLGEHEMMHRRCAIKVLPPKHQDDPDLLGRFHLEAEAIAKLDHPHIVRAYDFNKDVRWGKEYPYLVMEYIDGKDLRRMVNEQGPLDYRKAADYIRQAAEGLAHAHAAGLVHRDVKPANLLVDKNGVVKLLDLGLARFTYQGEQPWQTADGDPSAVGTADYVPPEQAVDSRSVDGRADIYSLGLTFYFLLTGHRPFPKNSLPELLLAHQTETPEPISAVRPDVPPDLVDIINRMTAKKPLQRFQTAQEVAEKLQNWLHELDNGPEYSRISALMAAAMRTKSPTGDSAAPKSEPSKDIDLELAFLDDDPKPSRGPSETDRSGLVKTAAKPKERKPSPTDSGVRRAAALPDLLSDDLLAASSDPNLSVVEKSGGFPFVAHVGAKHDGNRDLLKSPWLWVGVATVGLVLLLAIVIAISSNGTSDTARRPTSPPPAPSYSLPRSSPPSAVENEPKRSSEVRKRASPNPPFGSFEESEQKLPVDRATLGESQSSKPDEPFQAPKANELADPDRMLANAKKVWFQLRSNERDPKGPLNTAIFRQWIETARQLDLQRVRSGPNLMQVELTASSNGDLFTVVLSAEFSCADTEGKTTPVWVDTQQVLSASPQRMPTEQILKLLKSGVEKFFQKFAEDVKAAREKSAAN